MRKFLGHHVKNKHFYDAILLKLIYCFIFAYRKPCMRIDLDVAL